MARQIETAMTEAKAMCKGAIDDAVHAVHVKGPQQHGKFKKGKYKPHSASHKGRHVTDVALLSTLLTSKDVLQRRRSATPAKRKDILQKSDGEANP